VAKLALVFGADDIVLDEQDAVDLLVGRGFGDEWPTASCTTSRLERRVKAAIRSSWLRYLPMPSTMRLAMERKVLSSSTSESGHSRLLLLNSAMTRLATAVRASGKVVGGEMMGQRRQALAARFRLGFLAQEQGDQIVQRLAQIFRRPISSCSAAEPPKDLRQDRIDRDRTSLRGVFFGGAFP
jgi:hypothetical protein